MKTIIFIMITLIFSFSTFSSFAKGKAKKVDAKCHVELYGGGETVFFRSIKKGNLQKLEQRLVNRKIKVAKVKGKQKIYKVLECVYLEDDFTKTKSNTVDKAVAR